MDLFGWLSGKKKTQSSPPASSPSLEAQKQPSHSASEKPTAPSAPTQHPATENAVLESGAKPQMTRLTISRDFPQEVTKGCSRKQVSELIRASARYMWTAIGTYLERDGVRWSDEKTTGVTDPSAASMVFEMSVATTDEARVIKDVQFHWNNLIRAIQEHGGVDGFCAEYRKEVSTPTKFNPHKPICDRCGRELNPAPLFRVGDHYPRLFMNFIAQLQQRQIWRGLERNFGSHGKTTQCRMGFSRRYRISACLLA